jgi:hypothetical protein
MQNHSGGASGFVVLSFTPCMAESNNFVRFLVPAKFEYAAPISQLRPLVAW